MAKLAKFVRQVFHADTKAPELQGRASVERTPRRRGEFAGYSGKLVRPPARVAPEIGGRPMVGLRRRGAHFPWVTLVRRAHFRLALVNLHSRGWLIDCLVALFGLAELS